MQDLGDILIRIYSCSILNQVAQKVWSIFVLFRVKY